MPKEKKRNSTRYSRDFGICFLWDAKVISLPILPLDPSFFFLQILLRLQRFVERRNVTSFFKPACYHRTVLYASAHT